MDRPRRRPGRLELTPLLFVLLLTLSLFAPLAPPARASAANPGPVEIEAAYQLGLFGGATTPTATTDAFSVTAGKTYVIVTSTVNEVDTGIIYVNGSASGNYGTVYPRNASAFPAPGFTLSRMRSETGTFSSKLYALQGIALEAKASETLTLTISDYLGFQKWNTAAYTLPPGVAAPADLMGYVAPIQAGGSTVGHLLEAPPVLTESGILSTQVSTTPSSTKFTWTRLNSALPIFAQTVGQLGGSDGNVEGISRAQKIVGDPTKGTYLESFRFTYALGFPSNGFISCSGKAYFSVSTDLSEPWNNATERANLTFDFAGSISSSGASTNAPITVDFTAGTITASGGLSTWYSNPQAYQFGNPVPASQAPLLDATTPLYLHVHHAASCSKSATFYFVVDTANPYPGGDSYVISDGAWTLQAGRDWYGLELRTYGGSLAEYRLNATAATTGGAFYTYVRETRVDNAPQRYGFTSSFGGSAFFAGFQEATGDQYVIQQWRLGYLELPQNATASHTLTLNTTGSGRNVLHTGTLVNQPSPRPNIARTTFASMTGTNALTVYNLLSTDDYYTEASFTLKKCLDAECQDLGDLAANATYEIEIGPGGRTVAGAVNETGAFLLVGQDLAGKTLLAVFGGLGYHRTPWDVTIPGAGRFAFTLGVLLNETAGEGRATLQKVRVTFEGNLTRIVPDQLWINVTRDRAVDLYIDFVRVDPATGTFTSVTAPIPWPSTSSGNLSFTHPSLRLSQPKDAGKYHVFAWYGNATPLAGANACIGRTWAEASDCGFIFGAADLARAVVDSAIERNQEETRLQQVIEKEKERQVISYYMDLLAFLFRPDFGVPNLVLFLLMCFLVAAAGIATPRGD